MDKSDQTLENINAPVRFHKPKSITSRKSGIMGRRKTNDSDSLFLRKRVEQGSIDFDYPQDITEGPGEVLVPEEDNMNFDIAIRNKRNSILRVKQRPYFPFMNDKKEEEEEQPKEELPKKSNVGRRKKNKDEFDFGINLNKKIKEMKEETIEKVEKPGKSGKGKSGKKKGKVVKEVDEGIEERPEGQNFHGMDEENRLKIKITKVNSYWTKKSIMIPNALRLCHLLEDDEENLLEFQDYSKKGVLVQGNGIKREAVRLEKERADNGGKRRMSLYQRRSFNIMLNIPEDLAAFMEQ